MGGRPKHRAAGRFTHVRPGRSVRYWGAVGGTITTLSANDSSPCADHEFVAVSSSGASNAPLVNRHKSCQEYQNLPEMLKVDLMRRTMDSQWEYYRPGIAVHERGTFNVGKIALKTRVHAFLAGGGLSKAHQIDVNAVSFEFAPEFPAHA